MRWTCWRTTLASVSGGNGGVNGSGGDIGGFGRIRIDTIDRTGVRFNFDPLADFAYHAMTWRVTPELFRGLAGIDFAAAGIPDEAAYVAAYCRRTGRDRVAEWEFYMVYSLFRIAAIVQGIAKRAIEGTAASHEAVEIGRLARPFAEQAWTLAGSLGG